MIDYRATIKQAHSTLTIWYGYFMGGVLVLQSSWDQIDDYIPKKWRHLIVGIITALVIADKIRRSVRDKDEPAG